MRRLGSSVALLAMVLWSTVAVADVVRLEELTTKAVARRGAVAAARARTRAASARAQAAKADASPRAWLEIEGGAAPGRKLVRVRDIEDDEYFVQGSRALGQDEAFLPQMTYGGVVSLGGPLYDFGRTRAVIEAAEARAGAARAGEAAATASVIREVKRAYLAWLLAHGADALARRELAIARQQESTVERAVREGQRPASEIASARFKTRVAELEQARSAGVLDAARVDLGLAVGEPLKASAEPDASLLERGTHDAVPARDSAEATALRKRHLAALAAARAAGRTGRPVLSGVLEGGVKGQNERVFPAYQVGVSLSVPLWDGGSSAARRRAAQAEASEIEEEARERTRILEAELTRARLDLDNANERVRIAAELLEAARQRERDADARYALGEITLDQVAYLRADRLRAEQELLSAKVERLSARFRLEQGP